MLHSIVAQKGDTLARIARRHAVNVESLLAVNPQLLPELPVVPGQVLHIPHRTEQRYVIQAADTFDYIVDRFGVAPTDLLGANPGLEPGRLRDGQTIVLPPARGVHLVRTAQPYGYTELVADVVALGHKYPFAQVSSIGQSVMGKPLYAVRIGSGAKEVHINAAMHANEWITASLLMKFVEDLAAAASGGAACSGRAASAAEGAARASAAGGAEGAHKAAAVWRGIDAAALLERVTLWAVPMVNPDGVELVHTGVTPQHPYYERLLEMNNGSFTFTRWKANVRGVDLNDQFPAHWEAERDRREVAAPGPRNYPGEKPLSEPEAQALAAFTRAHRFEWVVALHTQGQEIYWNYRDYEPAAAEPLARRLAGASGYRAVKLSGSDAGYKDWFIQDFRKPGFTVECGFGVNPLPLEQFDDMYDCVADLLVEALVYAGGGRNPGPHVEK